SVLVSFVGVSARERSRKPLVFRLAARTCAPNSFSACFLKSATFFLDTRKSLTALSAAISSIIVGDNYYLEAHMQNMYTMIILSDMDRSVRFYRDTLGLKLRFQSPDWTEFDMGTTTLALHGGGKPAPPRTGPAESHAGSASIGFSVQNLDAEYEDLQKKGVRF